MCFSANASFGGSVAIGTIAVITLLQVKKLSQVPFAAIPLFFAVQQFTEGMLWVALSDPVHDSWQHYPINVFLIFAQLIWPFWVPFSVFLLEGNQIRRRLLLLVLVIGLMVSSYLLYCMLVFEVSNPIRTYRVYP